MSQPSLRARLVYEPQELKFGTSGRRGLVRDLSQLEIYVNVLGELRHLQSLPAEAGGIRRGEEFYFATDFRPSSTKIVEDQGSRGELCQAVERAIAAAAMRPVNLGRIPTPALACFALARTKASIMVTGSHIPFDRNGYKLYTSRGELLKEHEHAINRVVQSVREEVYAQPFADSIFNERGMFGDSHDLSPPRDDARAAYVARYREFFRSLDLRGRRVVVYEHSAVGREVLVEILGRLGAEVVSVGRSDAFVPVDTENVDDETLRTIADLVRGIGADGAAIDAILSTDGDSDRPLLLGWDSASRAPLFFPGDLLGMITAQILEADAVVVPVTCNDGIDSSALAGMLEPKTRVGSPFVIAGMNAARAKGRRRICGWEANGGFLTGSDIERNGAVLSALATRDAMLPLLAVLTASVERRLSLPAIFETLPARFGRSALLRNFPRENGLRIVHRLSPVSDTIRDVIFTNGNLEALDEQGGTVSVASNEAKHLHAARARLQSAFAERYGFGRVASINYTDGVRVSFTNGDVAHVRPSGNADELRIYAVANTRERAEQICQSAVGEPGGALRMLEALPADLETDSASPNDVVR